ncbi:MAG: DUF4870 family protein [Parashewanella sp.]
MSYQNDANLPLSDYDSNAKTHALIAYVLMGLGLLTGIFWFVGFIWAMVKKADATQSIFQDHYKNICSVFVWGLIFSLIGIVTVWFFVGWFILFAVFIWTIYRLVKGVANLTSNRPFSG